MKRRRFLGLGAGVAGAFGLPATLTGCGGDSSDDIVILRLLAAEFGTTAGAGSTQRYWNDIATAFHNRTDGVRIDVNVVSYENASDQLARMIEAGEPPDVAHVAAFADFAEAGDLYRADQLLPLPVLADFVPSIARAGERQRVQYGMPLSASVMRLFYNADLFESAGLDPDSPPRDWDELIEAASALEEAGVASPFGLPLGHDDAHAEAVTWMLAGGGALTDSTGTYTIDSYVNVETFTWLRDELVIPGLAGSSNPARLTRDDVYQGFAEGNVGMLMADTLLMTQADLAGVRYRTASVPGVDDPAISTLGQATWVVAFNHNGHLEEIRRFLEFVFTNDTVSSFAARNELLPVTTPDSQEIAASDNEDAQRIAPFLEQLPGASFYPVGKVSWGTVAANIASGIGAAVQRDSNVAEILGQLQTEAEAADVQAGV